MVKHFSQCASSCSCQPQEISFRFFPVHLVICQGESFSCLCSWFPHGFHHFPPLLLWLAVVMCSKAEVRWPSFCHFSLLMADMLELLVHILSLLSVSRPHQVFCALCSHNPTETFKKQFFLGFACLLQCPCALFRHESRWAWLSDTMLRTIALWLVLCFWARVCGLTPPHPLFL